MGGVIFVVHLLTYSMYNPDYLNVLYSALISSVMG